MTVAEGIPEGFHSTKPGRVAPKARERLSPGMPQGLFSSSATRLFICQSAVDGVAQEVRKRRASGRRLPAPKVWERLSPGRPRATILVRLRKAFYLPERRNIEWCQTPFSDAGSCCETLPSLLFTSCTP